MADSKGIRGMGPFLKTKTLLSPMDPEDSNPEVIDRTGAKGGKSGLSSSRAKPTDGTSFLRRIDDWIDEVESGP